MMQHSISRSKNLQATLRKIPIRLQKKSVNLPCWHSKYFAMNVIEMRRKTLKLKKKLSIPIFSKITCYLEFFDIVFYKTRLKKIYDNPFLHCFNTS